VISERENKNKKEKGVRKRRRGGRFIKNVVFFGLNGLFMICRMAFLICIDK
jgi:uncharacterized membrane protein